MEIKELKTYYILVKSWTVYVMTEAYLNEHGGKDSEWIKHWQLVQAENLLAARAIGEEQRLKSKTSYPKPMYSQEFAIDEYDT